MNLAQIRSVVPKIFEAQTKKQNVTDNTKNRTLLACSNEARDDGMAVASAGPHANHLHLAPDR